MRHRLTLDVTRNYDDILSLAMLSANASVAWRRRVVLRFFLPSKVNVFAKTMGQRITTRCPPVIANNPEQIVSQKRMAEILEDIFSSAPQFQRENRLGRLGKAKLGHVFKWELREIGYEEKFVDFAVEKLIEQLTPRTE